MHNPHTENEAAVLKPRRYGPAGWSRVGSRSNDHPRDFDSARPGAVALHVGLRGLASLDICDVPSKPSLPPRRGQSNMIRYPQQQ